MSAPYRIETERLVLRCYDPEDAPLLKDAVDPSLEHLRPWMPWTPDEPEALDTVYERLRGFRGQLRPRRELRRWVSSRPTSRACSAAPGCTRGGRGRARDRLLDRARTSIGQGFATELSAVLTRVGFEHFGLDRIEIRVDPENERSEKVPREARLHAGGDAAPPAADEARAPTCATSTCGRCSPRSSPPRRAWQYEYVAYDALGRQL